MINMKKQLEELNDSIKELEQSLKHGGNSHDQRTHGRGGSSGAGTPHKVEMRNKIEKAMQKILRISGYHDDLTIEVNTGMTEIITHRPQDMAELMGSGLENIVSEIVGFKVHTVRYNSNKSGATFWYRE